MFNEQAEKPDFNRAPGNARSSKFPEIALLSITELIHLRDQITRMLPPVSLDKVDLEEELLLQLYTVRKLQSDVIDDDDTPANQRAQVANAVTTSLNKLVDLQASVYSQERFKAIESLMIRHLKKLPEDVLQPFLQEYRELLEALK